MECFAHALHDPNLSDAQKVGRKKPSDSNTDRTRGSQAVDGDGVKKRFR